MTTEKTILPGQEVAPAEVAQRNGHASQDVSQIGTIVAHSGPKCVGVETNKRARMLQNMMKSRGLTLRDVAKSANVSHQTVLRALRGENGVLGRRAAMKIDKILKARRVIGRTKKMQIPESIKLAMNGFYGHAISRNVI